MITLGIDIGSITTKAAVMKDGTLLGSRVGFTGYNIEKAWRHVTDELLGELGLEFSVNGENRFHRVRQGKRRAGAQVRHGDHLPRRGRRTSARRTSAPS